MDFRFSLWFRFNPYLQHRLAADCLAISQVRRLCKVSTDLFRGSYAHRYRERARGNGQEELAPLVERYQGKPSKQRKHLPLRHTFPHGKGGLSPHLCSWGQREHASGHLHLVFVRHFSWGLQETILFVRHGTNPRLLFRGTRTCQVPSLGETLEASLFRRAPAAAGAYQFSDCGIEVGEGWDSSAMQLTGDSSKGKQGAYLLLQSEPCTTCLRIPAPCFASACPVARLSDGIGPPAMLSGKVRGHEIRVTSESSRHKAIAMPWILTWKRSIIGFSYSNMYTKIIYMYGICMIQYVFEWPVDSSTCRI